jgi:hypothetical protein
MAKPPIAQGETDREYDLRMARDYPDRYPLKAGDQVTMDVPRRRRWWQLWKPRHWTEEQRLTVESVIVGKPWPPAKVRRSAAAPRSPAR